MIISIHAPLTGRDRERETVRWKLFYFNPRAPYGARPRNVPGMFRPIYFNPRAPYGARPKLKRLLLLRSKISIHAPLTGRDSGSANSPAL